MNRRLIVFGVFLSVFILLLVPNIGCVNSIVPKDEISNFNNIRSYDLKKTENIMNSDCGCKVSKVTISHNYTIICHILAVILSKIFALAMNLKNNDYGFLSNLIVILMIPFIKMGELFNCPWISSI